mmetsp:Transcript_19980/g.62617  ORF Transcript_19980/g.62617 Transcript_19980/m.62617 type:complete len:153 (+) Transcript_19980:331-789(+)
MLDRAPAEFARLCGASQPQTSKNPNSRAARAAQKSAALTALRPLRALAKTALSASRSVPHQPPSSASKARKMDDGERIAEEVLREDKDHAEKGEREEWAAHVGWHRREDVFAGRPEVGRAALAGAGTLRGASRCLHGAFEMHSLCAQRGENA